MIMKATNTPQPAQAPAQADEDEPVEKVPPSPVAVPALPETSDDLPPSTQPTTAKPPTPREPIVHQPWVKPERQPIALDLPMTEFIEAPLPDFAELFKPDPKQAPESAEPTEIPESLAQATRPDGPVTESPGQQPSKLDEPPRQAEPSSATTKAQDQPPAEPAPRTADASEASTEQTESPAEKDADDPPAVVYDEDSVDHGISFKDKVRPRLSMISKRLGESGKVRILIEVDASGQLVRHEILDDAGFPRLLAAALKAMKDSSFEPAKLGDQPVRSKRVIEYRF